MTAPQSPPPLHLDSPPLSPLSATEGASSPSPRHTLASLPSAASSPPPASPSALPEHLVATKTAQHVPVPAPGSVVAPLSSAALEAHTGDRPTAGLAPLHISTASTFSGSQSVATDDVPAWARHALGAPAEHTYHHRTIRHLCIQQGSQSIKGSFHIGPGAPDVSPPRFDMPSEDIVSKSSASAVFEGRNSAVNVTVWVHEGGHDSPQRGVAHGHRRVVSASDASHPEGMGVPGADNHRHGKVGARGPGKPIMINAKSYMGNVKLTVPQYTCSRPLSIRAKTHHGAIHLHIPPTFSGMISWKTESGTFKPSAAILARYTPLGERRKHRGVGRIRAAEWTHDVGSPQSPPLAGVLATSGSALDWTSGTRGDSIELITTNGSLFLYEAGEESDSSANCNVM